MVCIFLSDLIRIEELVLNQINAAQKDGRILQRGWNQMTVLFHRVVQCIGDVFTQSGTQRCSTLFRIIISGLKVFSKLLIPIDI